MVLTVLVLCFLGTAASGVLFNVPPRALIPCGLIGAIAWAVSVALEKAGLSPIAGTFVAAFLVALLAEILARVIHLPATCFAVPGVIPLAPGVSFYEAMYRFVLNDTAAGNSLAVKALLIAAAISAGLAMAGALFRIVPHARRNP